MLIPITEDVILVALFLPIFVAIVVIIILYKRIQKKEKRGD